MRISRRTALRSALLLPAGALIRPTAAQEVPPARFSIPVALPGRLPGDGFLVRHGYATENTWYNPGWWHTGEDWYTRDGDSAGAPVVAVAAGEVVYAGFDYPGPVVIVRHAADLFSMYGHLDPALAVEPGEPVERGQLLGTILHRTDGRAPSHLHFEVRTFLTTPEVNGDAPRYDYGCGFECPPGPGYWPISAPEHPSALGWRNPTHVLARRAFADRPPADAEVAVADGAAGSTTLWSAPSNHDDAEPLTDLPLTAGDRYRLVSIATGSEASQATSAEGYRLWYRIVVPDVGRAWVQAAVASSNDTGSDGRPSSVRFDFVPIVAAESRRTRAAGRVAAGSARR